MPTVVFATPHDPTASTGSGLVTRGRLRALARLGVKVHLVLEGRPPSDPVALAALCTEVRHQPRRGPTAGSILRSAARIATTGRPLKWNAHTFALLQDFVDRTRPDAVVLDDLRLAEHGRLLRAKGYRGRIALHEHNVEHQLLARQRAHTKGLGKRLELGMRVRRFKATESQLASLVDVTLALTEDDRKILTDLNPGADVRWVPPDVDTDRYQPLDGDGARELVFVGSLNWAANRDGIEWFVREVWPIVKAGAPDVRLTIAGRDPPAWLRVCDPQISAPGFVDDEREAFARARALIVPLRFGSGVRIKILTAFALRRAVVSTPLGCEGIPAKAGEDLLVADDAAAFARETLRLLDDPTLARRVAAAGHEVCRAHYAPEVVARRFAEALGLGG